MTAQTVADHPAENPTNPANPVNPANSTSARLLAWGAHALTMSGLAFATLSMLSLIHGEIGWMWVWLAVALLVDGVDGTYARYARVKEVVPWFDGGILDIVIDYLTWTFIPALFMYKWVPMGSRPVASFLLILILVSSMFCYANAGWKSTDNYFVGFPAAWNIAAVMVWILQTPAWLNIVATIVLAVLTLVPTHYVHPARVTRFRTLNIIAVLVWFAGTAWALVVIHYGPLQDSSRTLPLILSVVSGLWLVGVGVIRDVHGQDQPAGEGKK